jgi:hypothetical protein
MAYCEAAQKECPYLDILERTISGAIVLRAVTKSQAETSLASNIEAGISTVAEVTEGCNQEYCGLIGLAVAKAVLEQAQNKGKRL